MIIKQKRPDYQIRELTYKKEAGSIRISWRYKDASDYFIILNDSRQQFDLTAACEEINHAGYCDADFTEQSKKLLFVGQSACWKAAYIKKAEFHRGGKCFCFSANELKKDVPYRISVFACTFDTQIHIFPTDTRKNICYLPVKVKADIRYKTKFFSKEKYCMLRLPVLEDYKDGAILYHIDGVACDFPLPQSCLGRELTVVVPRRSKVSIRIREEDKKYYRKE